MQRFVLFFGTQNIYSHCFIISLFCLFFSLPVHTDITLFAVIGCVLGLMGMRFAHIPIREQDNYARLAYAGFGLLLLMGLIASLIHPASSRSLPRLLVWASCVACGAILGKSVPQHRYTFMYALVAALIGSALVGYLFGQENPSSIFHGERLKLYALHPSRLALCCAAAFFFCLQYALTAGKLSQRCGHYLIALFLASLIILTNTRAMIAMLPIASLLLVTVLPQHLQRRLLTLVLIVVLAGAAYIWQTRDERESQRFISAVTNLPNDNTFLSRLPIWEAGWSAFLDAPLTGNGLQSYKRKHQEYRQKHLETWLHVYPNHEKSVKAAHNIILGRLIDTGLPGAIGFMLFFATALFYALKGPQEGKWIAAFLFYYFGIGMLDDPLFRLNDSFIFLLAASAIASTAHARTKAKTP